MDIIQKIEEIAAESNIFEFGYVEIANLKYYQEIRSICEENSCRNYGTSWACPPAIGTLEECKERISKYDKMLLFTQKYALDDSFDFEGMKDGMDDFKRIVDDFHEKLNPILPEFMLLANEGCGRCSECTYPETPCRFPELLHHSIEGYGFIVNELASEAGVHYNNGSNTVTFFGALLFNQLLVCSGVIDTARTQMLRI